MRIDISKLSKCLRFLRARMSSLPPFTRRKITLLNPTASHLSVLQQKESTTIDSRIPLFHLETSKGCTHAYRCYGWLDDRDLKIMTLYSISKLQQYPLQGLNRAPSVQIIVQCYNTWWRLHAMVSCTQVLIWGVSALASPWGGNTCIKNSQW